MKVFSQSFCDLLIFLDTANPLAKGTNVGPVQVRNCEEGFKNKTILDFLM